MRNLRSILFFISLVLLAQTAFAQQDWRWDTHGVGFSAPANLRVTTNNAEEFAAEGSDIALSIQAMQDGEITKEDLATALVAAATEMKYDNISAASEVSIDDFSGYFVDGTKDDVGALIVMLLDKKSATNLIIVIAYTTDEARQKAIDVADSFYAFD